MFQITLKICAIAILTLQLSNANVISSHIKASPIEDVNATLQQLITDCETAQKLFITVKDNLIIKLDIQQQIQESNIPVLITDQIEVYKKVLDDIRNASNASIVDECLENTDQMLFDIQAIGIDLSNDCVNKNHDTGLNLLESGQESVDWNVKTVKQLQEELGLCEADDEKCADEVAEVVESCSKFPELFVYQTNLVSETVDYISSIMGSCSTKGFYAVQDMAQALVHKVVTCING